MVSIFVCVCVRACHIIHNYAVQIWKKKILLNINKFPPLNEADIYWK